MRDILTIFGGLLLLALIAAVVAPHFVDWSGQRRTIEQAMRDRLGLEAVTTGPLAVRLLPSPRLEIEGVRIGAADPVGTRMVARRVTAELELSALLRGEVKLADVRVDGAVVTLVSEEGGVRLPPRVEAVQLEGVGRFALADSTLRLVDRFGAERQRVPLSLEGSMPLAAGPWRVEGQLGGRSVRVAAGERDAAKGLRLKFGVYEENVRAEFDGWLASSPLDGDRPQVLLPALEGQVQVVIGVADRQGQALQVSGQLRSSGESAAITPLTVELPGTGRLEGEAALALAQGGSAEIKLGARRLDINALIDGDGRAMVDLVALNELLAPFGSLGLNLRTDGISWRGEDFSDVVLEVEMAGGEFRSLTGKGGFAGATGALEPLASGGHRLTIQAPDLRRVALAASRVGLPAALADDVAAFGSLSLTARLGRPGALAEGWSLDEIAAKGPFGEVAGTVSWVGEQATARLEARGVDLLTLSRPVMALTGRVPGDLALELAAEQARIGTGPEGRASLAASRAAGTWRVASAEAEGFDGLRLRLDGTTVPDQLKIALAAPRIEALAALGERLAASPAAAATMRRLSGLSPLDLEGTLASRADGHLLALRGRAGGVHADTQLQLGADGAWRRGGVTLTSVDRADLFATFGLPKPARRQVLTRAVLSATPSGPTLTISGEDGLALEARGEWPADGQRQRLSVAGTAPDLAAIAPALAAASGPAPAQGRLPVAFEVTLAEDGLALSGLGIGPPASRVTGELHVTAAGEVKGRLALPRLSLGAAAGLVTGRVETGLSSGWPTERLAAVPPVPPFDVELTVAALDLAGGAFGPAQGRLRWQEERLTLERVSTELGGVTWTASGEATRDGGLLGLRLALDGKGLDLGGVTGGLLAGRGDVALQLGSSGESLARLVAQLAGGGDLMPTGVSVQRFDPAALGRLGPTLLKQARDNATGDVARRVRTEIEAANWPLPEAPLKLLVSGGVLRISPVTDQRPEATAQFTFSHDWRTGQVEGRLAAQAAAPEGWLGQPPQLAVTVRRPAGGREAERSYDLAALGNALAQKTLQSEIERVEDYEADIRERAMFNRRLRLERERKRREDEQAAEARRVEDELRANEERIRAEMERWQGPGLPGTPPPAGRPLPINPRAVN